MLRGTEKYTKNGHIVINITRTNAYILSPYWNTINTFKSETKDIGIERAWKNFIPKYLNDINTIGADKEIQNIVNLVNSKVVDIYLACFCNTNKYCHRYILFNKINKSILDKQTSIFDY